MIRKYEPTSAVAPATPAARRMKIKQKKFFPCRVFFVKVCFSVNESGVGLWVVGIITLQVVSQGRRQHCAMWIRMSIKSGMI